LVTVYSPIGPLQTCIVVIDVTWLGKQPSPKYVPERWVGNRGDMVPWCVHRFVVGGETLRRSVAAV